MRFIPLFLRHFIAILGIYLILSVPAFAFLEGTLISSDSSTLKLYPQPNLEQAELGTGNVGDKVIVLEQVYNNQGENWDHIRMVQSPDIEGWIKESYVDKPSDKAASDNPYDPSNYYQINQFQ
jgi:hypothetical protein